MKRMDTNELKTQNCKVFIRSHSPAYRRQVD